MSAGDTVFSGRAASRQPPGQPPAALSPPAPSSKPHTHSEPNRPPVAAGHSAEEEQPLRTMTLRLR